jgi:hypothetical protein
MHFCNLKKNLISIHSFQQLPSRHRYWTRRVAHHIMDNWQEKHDALQTEVSQMGGKVTQLGGKLAQVIEMLANLNVQPRRVEVPAPVVTVTQGNSSAGYDWPPFGLPEGYVPQVYVPATSAPLMEVPARVNAVQQVIDLNQEAFEDPRDAYQGPGPHGPRFAHRGPVPTVEEPKVDFTPQLEQKYQALEERLNLVETGSDPLDFTKMYLVSDVVLPPKFKMPDFEKYKGLSCPKNHLVMYIRKMASYAHDDKLMIFCFQDSLADVPLNWYMQLEGSRIHSWRDLANAFCSTRRK